MTATQAADPPLRPAVEAVLPEALDLSQRVNATREIAFEERQPAQWTRELLVRHGLEVLAASAVELVRNAALVDQAWAELRAQGGWRRPEPSAG
ncbi:MAG: hypothetical protein LC744_02615 [Chloroflexi bacterium]|nr:hypothetical protein [Chloroflexota bacterium]